MPTLNDFFGDGSKATEPVCSYCGRTDGVLIVSIQDANGPTHWTHEECKKQAKAEQDRIGQANRDSVARHEAMDRWEQS